MGGFKSPDVKYCEDAVYQKSLKAADFLTELLEKNKSVDEGVIKTQCRTLHKASFDVKIQTRNIRLFSTKKLYDCTVLG